MQKVYALLLAELRKLGATIVFADFSRIIIATGKFQVPAAQGYCEYLLKTIKTRYVTCGFISILWQLKFADVGLLFGETQAFGEILCLVVQKPPWAKLLKIVRGDLFVQGAV